MELAEDEILQKYDKQCMHCLRKTILPYDYEFTCTVCGYNVTKRKNELTKTQQRKKIYQ